MINGKFKLIKNKSLMSGNKLKNQMNNKFSYQNTSEILNDYDD